MPPNDLVKLLLVDDLEENLLALEAVLRRDDIEMHKAKSGAEALELLLRHDYALALLDVQMPGIDGFELAELMRGTERTRRVPIILVTAVATDERRRFRGYEAGAVDYLFKPLDSEILRQKVEVFVELDRRERALARQRDELSRTADQLASALERLRAHRDNSPLAVVEFDPECRVIGWSRGAQRVFGWPADAVLGRPIDEFGWLTPGDADAIRSQVLTMLSQGQRRTEWVYKCRRKDGAVLDCEWHCAALLEIAGGPVSVNAQILDVTERRRAEETQQLLIGELNHRVKNMLATVQAIATQTLRHTDNAAEFASNFSGRIRALARAHSLLSSETWQGAGLAELVQDQLQLGTMDEARMAAAGPEVWLTSQTALHLAMILHELTTNAAKYGALSSPQGRVDLNWTVDDGELRLTWAERCGHAVKAPSRRGFGTTLIERSIEAEGGSARATYRVDGITWNLSMRLQARTTVAGDRAARSVSPYADAASGGFAGAQGHVAGRRGLIIEDEPLIALELAGVLEDAGAVIVGIAAKAAEAVKLIESGPLDFALLDGNLHGSPADELAALLTRHQVPFMFVSGYDSSGLPRGFQHVPVLGKPCTPRELLNAVALLGDPPAQVLQLQDRRPLSRAEAT